MPCLHELFETQAALHPAAVAVVHEHRALTYGELNARANQLAHHLRALGVGPETPVALYLERSLELAVALLGILKAGGAYVPLDPAYPPDRLAYMLADTAAPVLLTHSALRERLPAPGVQAVCLDRDWAGIAQHPTSDPLNRTRPANLAYCVYTSGSTGRPKAVTVSQASIVNHCLHVRDALALGARDRVLQFVSLSFDAAAEEIFPTWFAGAALVLLPARLLSSHDFLRLLRDERISVLSLPVSYWHHWIEELAAAQTEHPPALRLVFVGGERVLAEKFARWCELPFSRGLTWMVDYGPTEATISCTTFTAGSAPVGDSVPIGRPIAGAQVHVLDAQGEPVPLGATGEIHIGGAGVARGYLNRPALTAEKFVPDPFGAAGGRLYRTGDLGRQRADGNLEFVGRADDQVKILGHRIEPGEIESALLRCAGVRDAAVLAREDVPGDVRLTGYVVAPGLAESDLRAALAGLLPAIMIPSALVFLPALPLSPVTGKLDRARLPRPAAEAAPPLRDASELELSVAALWADVVGHAPRSVEDDFFASGGESLRGLRLVSRLSELTGVNVVFADLFGARTVRGLAALLLDKFAHEEMVRG